MGRRAWRSPRFGWIPTLGARGDQQTAYEIVVSNAGGVVWDSGQVPSGASSLVAYGSSGSAKALTSDTDYVWAVRVWTAAGGATPSAYSAAQGFRVGMLPGSSWSAAWIACAEGDQSGSTQQNQLRSQFSLAGVTAASVQRAVLYVTGAGYYRFFVNGAQAGPAWVRLDPAWTLYNLRALYTAFDVKAQLQSALGSASGPVVLAAELGNGWPDVLPNPFNGSSSAAAAAPVLLAERAPGDTERSQPLVDVEASGGVTRDPVTPRVGYLHAIAAQRLGLAPGARPSLAQLRRRAPRVWFDESAQRWRLGWDRANATRRLFAQLSLTLTNGTVLQIATAASGTPTATGSVLTPAWQCGSGPRVDDSVYDGETYDQRLETPGWNLPNYNTAGWTSALPAPPFTAGVTLTAAAMPLVGDLSYDSPVNISNPQPGVWVFDFGLNAAGVSQLRLPAGVLAAGQQVALSHAEVLMHEPYGPADGTVYTANLRSATATDLFTASGAAVNWTASFTYHGFRYVQVTGLPAGFTPSAGTLTAVRFASQLQWVNSFRSSSSLLNGVHFNAARGELSNAMSLLSDCDQRDERKGWSGDGGLSGHTYFVNFHAAPLLQSWITSMGDDLNNQADMPAGSFGSISDTVPHTFGNHPGDPNWQTVYPTILQQFLWHWGDTRIVASQYNNLHNYGAFLNSKLAAQAAALYSYYGDWCPPPQTQGGGQGPKPPGSLVSLYAFINDYARLIEFATAVHNASDAANFANQRNVAVNVTNKAFFNASAGVYGNSNWDGLQTAHAVALTTAGLVPPASVAAVRNNLIYDIVYNHDGTLSTGILGVNRLFFALVDAGRGDIALDILLQDTYPGFGYMLRNPIEPSIGSTWELWDAPAEGPGMNSRST